MQNAISLVGQFKANNAMLEHLLKLKSVNCNVELINTNAVQMTFNLIKSINMSTMYCCLSLKFMYDIQFVITANLQDTFGGSCKHCQTGIFQLDCFTWLFCKTIAKQCNG